MINFIFCQQISTALSSHVFIHVNFQAKTIQLIYNFNPLWINTALKRYIWRNEWKCRFNPLWINTALKRGNTFIQCSICFNPLWINTALKLDGLPMHSTLGFNPLWINTALKHSTACKYLLKVSIPYGLTLLSNTPDTFEASSSFQSPMD